MSDRLRKPISFSEDSYSKLFLHLSWNFKSLSNKLFNICRCYLEEEYGADMASHLSDIFYYKQIEYTDIILF